MAKGQVSHIEGSKRSYENFKNNATDEERVCRKESISRWQNKNRDKINKQKRERGQHMKDGAACEIIKQHHENMKDNPERLTTEFMKSIVNIECDD